MRSPGTMGAGCCLWLRGRCRGGPGGVDCKGRRGDGRVGGLRCTEAGEGATMSVTAGAFGVTAGGGDRDRADGGPGMLLKMLLG
jgi:hypothetical protein